MRSNWLAHETPSSEPFQELERRFYNLRGCCGAPRAFKEAEDAAKSGDPHLHTWRDGARPRGQTSGAVDVQEKTTTVTLTALLNRELPHLSCKPFSRDLSQQKRDETLRSFKASNCKLMVSTNAVEELVRTRPVSAKLHRTDKSVLRCKVGWMATHIQKDQKRHSAHLEALHILAPWTVERSNRCAGTRFSAVDRRAERSMCS
eukprot:6486891-Amphidinium_carterae.1